MLTFNGKKFAEMKQQQAYAKGQCIGFYKVNRQEVELYNECMVKIGVVTCKGVLAKASLLDSGWWYSYGTIKQIGEYASLIQQEADVQAALGLLPVKMH